MSLDVDAFRSYFVNKLANVSVCMVQRFDLQSGATHIAIVCAVEAPILPAGPQDRPYNSMKRARAHSWEEPARGSRHRWEEDDDPAPDSDEEPAAPEDDPAVAAEMFLDQMLGLYFNSTISAEKLCTTCYYAGLGGMPESVSRLGFRPGAPSGHYQRYLDRVLEFSKHRTKIYQLEVCGQRKSDISRTSYSLPIMPLHEIVQEDIEADPAMGIKLDEAVADGLPPSFHRHVVTQAHDGRAVPLALYMDALPYTLTDSVWGIWVINILTGVRRLVAAVRKRLFCRCGCRGWCTVYPVLLSLRWSLKALAEGVYPSQRHDSSAWLASDEYRKGLAGRPMRFPCCLVQLKGDWDEFCGHLGFPTWKSSTRPCFLCAGSGPELYHPRGVSLHECPWPLNTDDDYEAAISRCEIWVTLSAEDHSRVRRALHYDRRPNGSHGRCLTKPLADLGLDTGDRLEPFPGLLDIGDGFDLLQGFPREVLFWRPRNLTVCTHRCPLFGRDFGVTPVSSIALDTLHTLNLGVMQVWCRHSLWRLLNSAAWGAFEPTEVDKLHTAVLCLRGELQAWHQQRAQSFPDESLTRLADITVKMIGTAAEPKLKLKGAETWTVLLFLLDMLQKYAGQVGAQQGQLVDAGRCLERLVLVMRQNRTYTLNLGVRQEHQPETCTPRAPPLVGGLSHRPSGMGEGGSATSLPPPHATTSSDNAPGAKGPALVAPALIFRGPRKAECLWGGGTDRPSVRQGFGRAPQAPLLRPQPLWLAPCARGTDGRV